MALLLAAPASADCPCLDNGGQPGPGACPCDVFQCHRTCVDLLCPWTANCTLECSQRCSCYDAPAECPSHEDPGATPTPVTTPRTYSLTACYTEVPNSACSPFGAPCEPPSLFGPIPYGAGHAATAVDGQPATYTFSDLPPGNYILRGGGCTPFGCRIESAVTVADEDVFAHVEMVPPRRPDLFRVCGRAAERPVPDPPLARFAIHTLHPLEQTVFSFSSGFFCFKEVPPGDYTITTVEYSGAPTHCTLYGCWPETPVTVVDGNVLDVFIAMLPLPTPTATPCLGDGDGDRQVTIDELVGAVANALGGCR
ncbi:MAG: hypothetical protein U0802_16335 [Candidatus Binatia bacterium]